MKDMTMLKDKLLVLSAATLQVFDLPYFFAARAVESVGGRLYVCHFQSPRYTNAYPQK